jgi:hypothetical protein
MTGTATALMSSERRKSADLTFQESHSSFDTLQIVWPSVLAAQGMRKRCLLENHACFALERSLFDKQSQFWRIASSVRRSCVDIASLVNC